MHVAYEIWTPHAKLLYSFVPDHGDNSVTHSGSFTVLIRLSCSCLVRVSELAAERTRKAVTNVVPVEIPFDKVKRLMPV